MHAGSPYVDVLYERKVKYTLTMSCTTFHHLKLLHGISSKIYKNSFIVTSFIYHSYSGHGLACQQEILLVLAKTPPIHYETIDG